ncbi:MAG: C10 family peptidase, partial [Verrucomicrobia bacterium]|nr:C10 family peptidase [Verrucomicrobiota bacterium]
VANPLGALVSGDLSARVAYARKAGSKPADISALEAQAKWQKLSHTNGGPEVLAKGLTAVSNVWIAPLIQTTWSQQTAADAGTAACYNYYTPPFGNGTITNYPSGCVATAMAQLMRYYQFPTNGVGTNSFAIYVNGLRSTNSLRGGNGAGGPYMWSDMRLVPPANPTTAQCQAIGALVADAGATVSMQYSSNVSLSSLFDARNALNNTFHFSSARYGDKNTNDIGAGLVAMINPNLDARYPVLLSIRASDLGHVVVADGYGYSLTTLYHHLNLGWSGTATAWYALPLIDTGRFTFNVVSGCLYNAYTNGSGEIISGRVLDQIGRPVVNATVTATRSPSGTYTATTDTNGIYALARIPSASSYSVTVTKANYSPVNGTYSTGTSSDWAANSGNYWGANFTMPMPTTVLDHLVWGSIASTQSLNTPFLVTITAQNLTNGLATGFTGPLALSAYMTGLVAGSSTIIGSLSPNMYRYSSAGLTHGYAFTPSTNIQVTAVRSYSGDKVSIWSDSGALLANQTVSSSGSWVEATLAAPIMLYAGTTYRVTGHYGTNVWGYYTTSSWPTTFANGSVDQTFYTASGDGFPVQVFTSAQGPLVDLRYQIVSSNSISISPTSSGAFASGVWSGNITVFEVATNMILQADDGKGHVAASTPFNVITSPLQLLSPQRPPGGHFQCTLSGDRGLGFEILASSNLINWDTLATLTNSTGTTKFTDPTPGLNKRFYRARQLR